MYDLHKLNCHIGGAHLLEMLTLGSHNLFHPKISISVIQNVHGQFDEESKKLHKKMSALLWRSKILHF